MCDKTKHDRIRNDNIRERVGITPIIEKMAETRLRWFGYVERRHLDFVVRRVNQTESSQTTRGRGRPRKPIRELIKDDLDIDELDKFMTNARTL